jgi:tetratricopeptide (TPR) repeat protein
LRAVVGAEPGNDEYRRNFCIALNMLARFTASEGRREEGEAIVAECASVTATWTQSTNTYYAISSRSDLADSHRVLGVTALQRQQFDVAQAHFARAIELLEQVLVQQPNYGLARNVAHGSYWSRAKMYETMGRDHDALRDWDRSIEYGDEKLRNIAWIGRTECRVRLGDYETAIAEADELLAKPELPGDVLFDLATIFCQCAQAASSVELIHSESDLVARAVSCLERSHSIGFFGEPAGLERLQTTPLFAVLRSSSDFQQLLKEVTSSADEE